MTKTTFRIISEATQATQAERRSGRPSGGASAFFRVSLGSIDSSALGGRGAVTIPESAWRAAVVGANVMGSGYVPEVYAGTTPSAAIVGAGFEIEGGKLVASFATADTPRGHRLAAYLVTQERAVFSVLVDAEQDGSALTHLRILALDVVHPNTPPGVAPATDRIPTPQAAESRELAAIFEDDSAVEASRELAAMVADDSATPTVANEITKAMFDD